MPFEVRCDLLLVDPIRSSWVALATVSPTTLALYKKSEPSSLEMTALNDFGGGLHFSRRLIDCDDCGQHDSVVSQVLPVAQANSSIRPVPESSIRVRPTGALSPTFALFSSSSMMSPLSASTMRSRDWPHLRAASAWAVELAGLAVDRDQEFRPHGVVHDLQVAFATVARSESSAMLGVDHVGVLLKVYSSSARLPAHCQDRRAEITQRVALHHAGFLVRIDGHSGERGHRLALAAGDQQADVARREPSSWPALG